MGIFQTILAFIICIGILVSIHEWGHFWVARKAGVKVLRFSIGFGRALFSWKDKQGTEFVLAMIPLGGYVKMLDEREDEVPPDEIDQAFNQKSVWARIAIAAAGPVANFVLAIIALWIMYLVGIKTVVPMVGSVISNSPAANGGIEKNEKIVAVDGREVHSWNDINLSLASLVGNTDPFSVTTESSSGLEKHQVSVKQWPGNLENQSLLSVLGIQPWGPSIPAIVGKTLEHLPARVAGIETGDRIVRINETPVSKWDDMLAIIRNHPGKQLTLDILRKGQPVTLEITPVLRKDESGKAYGFIGAQAAPVSWPENQFQQISYGLLDSFVAASGETWQLSCLTVKSIYKMVTGILSLDNLSGPVTIAKVASASLRSGIESFLYFIAMLSISLGVINLLPVPALDGGHLLYYIIEVIRGRPLSQKIQNFGLRIGIIVVLCVMLIALYNDFNRL